MYHFGCTQTIVFEVVLKTVLKWSCKLGRKERSELEAGGDT